ncbi:hypothetical protein ISF_04144 [Cordyceps fumosorosea ARSEF 2679]|uniref:Nephrocystin 3-like N-terminal domain-containing protein n=1 Tax=Cordyceps fumosorosea (strain ARSEF 2679) TaxID=1081104 RepID=A0A167YGT6_CORFA|nr:hypothetical protein ISF_04144 [Cordyceps fumosorosea ARSEF 2679]OAA66306.1 hypothetical protein ISF_04144 [Cordyceps fumosorosea ARSEF 2679]
MKFAHEKATKDREKVTISFFFNARGGELERSTPGMYRSLLFQLLTALPSLCVVFDELEHKDTLDELHAATSSNENPVWMLGVLQDLLRSALAKLNQKRLTIFVDALDECAPNEVEGLVEFFEYLGEDAVQSNSKLSILFSSRYYPQLDVTYGLKIYLEDEDGHEKDIAMYVRIKLKIGQTKTAKEVKAQIQKKAKGIFMWVVLVVGILNSEYLGGRIFEVKKKLDALPAKLSELFKEILLRDQTNFDDLKLCIRWILFARRPLQLEEYYFAVVSGLHPDALQEWDSKEVTLDDMRRFVICSSKGLAETTESRPQTVQFIHESVRVFFLGDGLQELWPDLAATDFASVSHDQLRQCCDIYLKQSLDSMITQDLLRLSNGYLPLDYWENEAKRDTLSANFPFLEYSTSHTLYHANAAARAIPQELFLKNFPVEAWVSLHNLFTLPRLSRYMPERGLLSIVVESNFAQLIKCMLRLDPRSEITLRDREWAYRAAVAADWCRCEGNLLG